MSCAMNYFFFLFLLTTPKAKAATMMIAITKIMITAGSIDFLRRLVLWSSITLRQRQISEVYGEVKMI